VKQKNLIQTAFYINQFPDSNLSEIAIAGRSNSGKSTLINKIFNIKKLAHTSSKPGKTKSINFYNLEDIKVLVDLPGYGYAKTSSKEINNWEYLVNNYINNREALYGILILIDIRRGLQDEEKFFINELSYKKNLKIVLIFTKIDKLSNNVLSKEKKQIDTYINKNNILIHKVFFISSLKNLGIKDLKDYIISL